MIWANHRMVTASLVFAVTGDVVAAGASVLGSTFPDSVEGHDYKTEEYNKSHRRSSHWFVPYLSATTAMLAFVYIPFVFATPVVMVWPLPLRFLDAGAWDRAVISALAFVPVGCLCHILEDAVCGKVPLWNSRRKVFGIRLFKVRSATEHAFALSLSFILIFTRTWFMLSGS